MLAEHSGFCKTGASDWLRYYVHPDTEAHVKWRSLLTWLNDGIAADSNAPSQNLQKPHSNTDSNYHTASGELNGGDDIGKAVYL